MPDIPAWQGRDIFAGTLIHSADFRTASQFGGQRVLVVGTGNSGCEIAALLADASAARVWLSRRRQPLIVPETLLGVSITAWGLPLLLLADTLVDAIGRFTHWWHFRDLARYGLGTPEKSLSEMRHRYYSPPIDRGIADAVRAGAVEVVDAVRGLDDDHVILRDGRRLRPDVVITATGYRTGLEDLVGHLGVLDADGEPVIDRHCGAVDTPGLYFAGFRFGLLALLPYVDLAARTIARHIAGTGDGNRTTPSTPRL